MSLRDLALQAADDAFKDSIKTTISALMSNLILAKADAERKASIERHKNGLSLCRDVHEQSIAAINAVFAQDDRSAG
jgi:hypothetical protein